MLRWLIAKLWGTSTNGKAGAATAPSLPASPSSLVRKMIAVAPTSTLSGVLNESRLSMHRVTMDVQHLREWPKLHPMLSDLFWSLANLWNDTDLVITSINRTKEYDLALGGSGIHAAGPPWRAIDISIKTLTGGQTEATRLADILNSMYLYDPARPDKPVCYSKPHGTGPHIHLQVHPQTIRLTA